MKYTNKYDDIIHLPHHVSATHPQMSIHDRAAQFSPFAALTGHGAAIKETERLTDARIELDENEKNVINEKLQMIYENLGRHPEVTITYFVPDEKKAGGKYVTLTACVKKIDTYYRMIVMEDGIKVPVDEVYDIQLGNG